VDVVGSQVELAHTPHADVEAAGSGCWRQFWLRGRALVRHPFHPRVAGLDDVLDFLERHILLQLDRQRQAVAAHRADADANAVDGNGLAGAEDLVDLGLPLPFLPGLAAVHLLVDPGNEAARQRRGAVRARPTLTNDLAD